MTSPKPLPAESREDLEEMYKEAGYIEERARRIQQLTDPRQVRQQLGAIAARIMRYMAG